MTRHEYTVIPAPPRADKVRGARSPADRFSATLAQVLNDMARQGWEYVRAETLPSEERSGIASRNTVWNNVLIFRRSLHAQEAASEAPAAPPQSVPPVSPPPGPATPVQAPAPLAPAMPAGTAVATPPAAPSANPFSEPMRAIATEDDEARG